MRKKIILLLLLITCFLLGGCEKEEEEPIEEDIKKDCGTCGFGHYNDHWGQNMCYDPDPTGHGCVMWSHWIPKEKSE